MPNASKSPHRPQKTLNVRATGLSDDGAGACTLPDGRKVLVAGLLPGELARVEIAHTSPHSGTIWATLQRRHSAAPERVVPVCSGYGRCGGCVLQHLDYEAQLRWKGERLQAALARAGVSPKEPVPPCVPSAPLAYRNRSKLVAARSKEPDPGKVVLGAYAPRSHTVVDMAGCRLPAPPLCRVAREIAALASGIPDLTLHGEGEGGLRYVLLRQTAAEEVQVNLVCSAPPPQAVRAALTEGLRALPQVVSATLHENRDPGDALLPPQGGEGGAGGQDEVLFGPEALWDRVGEISLRVSPRSFLQINRGVAARLYADVLAGLAPAPGESLLDLYCGVGGIGLTLLSAEPALRAQGVEGNPAAVADARAGAARADVAFAVQVGDVAAVLSAWAERTGRGEGGADLIVLNPPRRGCAPEVLDHIAALRPRAVAYVSCDPDTLARDLSSLMRSGLAVTRVAPYDMHPHTPHVEALALLSGRG